MRARRAVSSAGEHYLDMVGATGSIPVPPTIYINGLDVIMPPAIWTGQPPGYQHSRR